MFKKRFYLLFCMAWFSVGMHHAMNVQITGLPPKSTLVNIQKTIIHNYLHSIDLLFKNDKNAHYIWRYYLSHSTNSGQTNISLITDSINDPYNQEYRMMAVDNQYVLNNVQQNIAPLFKLHDKKIEQINGDNDFILTQSSYPNIRFWIKGDMQMPLQKPLKDTIAKEISHAFLLGYAEGTALWAKKDRITGKNISLNVGFRFSEQGTAFFNKDKKVYDFVKTQELLTTPFIGYKYKSDSFEYMPASFVSKDMVIVFDEHKKQLIIVRFQEKNIEIKTEPSVILNLESKKIVQEAKTEEPKFKKTGHIKINHISLLDIESKNSEDNTTLLYRTPKKIEYKYDTNKRDNDRFILIYDDRIISFANKKTNKKFTYKSLVHLNAGKKIVDAMLFDNNLFFVLVDQSNGYHYLCSLNIK